MKVHLDRNRLFALLGALEDDLRVLIDRELLPTHYEWQVLGPAYEKAADRFAGDSERDISETAIVDYLDLGDEIEILNRWRADLPAQTREALSELAGRLGDLVPIRNRVAHRRPLLADDLERAEQIILQLENRGFEGEAIRETLQNLRSDPTWVPIGPSQVGTSRTLNNLPLGDYDETGLVGRRRELEKLTKQLFTLSSSRSPVLTVVGPGGVGKTALALQALHDLVNDESCPYDLVSWVSLKTERLTARGVESIRDAVLSVEQALPAMIEALDPTFEGSAAQIAGSLDGLTALVVIDNLETVSGREVVDLVDALPESVSYLFTSREGLGEIERRFPLGPLEGRYAVDLLRRLARARGLNAFAQMAPSAAEDLVGRLGASPLGLKWFISGVEVGRDPQELVRHREDLVRFCVENVFDSLDGAARNVANVLHVLARPASAQELHLYLPDMPPDQLRSSIQSLDRRMLINRDLVAGSIAETFEASEPLSDYLRFSKVVDPDEARRVREADDAYRRAEERHRLDAASDPLRPNIVQGGVEHRASVLLLRDALLQSKRGEIEEALARVREAKALDQEFWEIPRVQGFILSSAGVVEDATTSYMRAIELAPSPDAAAAVRYFFAGHLTRCARDAERAVPIAQKAHDVLQSPRTAVELGRALTYTGDFDDAEQVLRSAIDADDVRTRLIAVTQLVECMKRRAEAEATVDRRPDVAIATLADAVAVAYDALREGLVDKVLAEKTVNLVSEMFKLAMAAQEMGSTQAALTKALTVVERLGAAGRRSRAFGYLVSHARRLVARRVDLAAGIPLLDQLAADDQALASSDSNGEEDTRELLGTIKAWKSDRHFGFITDVDQSDYFFDRAALFDPGDEIYLQRGTTVRFSRSSSSDGRPQARDVVVEDPDDEELSSRRLVVEKLHPSGNYLFARDADSGATVFVGRLAVADPAAWEAIEVGFELVSRVEIDDDGRFSAEARAARIFP